MVLLTGMVSNKGIVTGFTEENQSVTLDGLAYADVVFGLNEDNDADNALSELQKRARYNEAKYYSIGEIKISKDNKIFAIPYLFFIK